MWFALEWNIAVRRMAFPKGRYIGKCGHRQSWDQLARAWPHQLNNGAWWSLDFANAYCCHLQHNCFLSWTLRFKPAQMKRSPCFRQDNIFSITHLYTTSQHAGMPWITHLFAWFCMYIAPATNVEFVLDSESIWKNIVSMLSPSQSAVNPRNPHFNNPELMQRQGVFGPQVCKHGIAGQGVSATLSFCKILIFLIAWICKSIP